MKATTRLLLNILKKNPKESIDYFRKIGLGDSHEVKFGFTAKFYKWLYGFSIIIIVALITSCLAKYYKYLIFVSEK